MILTYYGHSMFRIETQGKTLVTDPFDPSVGYPVPSLAADLVTVSHHHGDHDYLSALTGSPLVADQPQAYALEDICVTGIPSVHDEAGGRKRGSNILFLIQAEGLRLVHLGDQGCPLTDGQIQALGRVDVLMVPVGGYYTIDAPQAKAMAEALHARVVIPMHYRTQVNAAWPIAPLEAFTRLYDQVSQPMPLIRITAPDLVCQPAVAILIPKQ